MRRRGQALALGGAAACLFIALASVRLEAQGPQYDELHPAAAAFTWLGRPAEMFCRAPIAGRLCTFNQRYSGAIKSNLYGLLLRATGSDFDLGGWRLVGILTIAGGLWLFAALVGDAWPPAALAIFLALLLTDVSVLVLGRVDWGPMALSLLLRLLLIGVWVRGESAGPSARNSGLLGLLAGLAIFEKLSAIVLVGPVLLFLLSDARRRDRRHGLTVAAGFALGAAPVWLINIAAWILRREVYSVADLGELPRHSLRSAGEMLGQLLALGQGAAAGEFVLGIAAPPWAVWAEVGALPVALALAAAIPAAARRRLGMPAIAVGAYLLTAVGLHLLPARTWIHHWLLATPFQYAAVGAALAAAAGVHRRRALAAVAILWVAIRLPSLVAVEQALVQGRSALAWDRSLAHLGEFAERHAGEAEFVASDWGVGTQIYCWTEGQAGRELFWDYRGPEQLRAVAGRGGRRLVYLARLRGDPVLDPEVTRAIERDLAADPAFEELPVEPEAQAWRAVQLRKFRYLGPPAADGRPGTAAPTTSSR